MLGRRRCIWCTKWLPPVHSSRYCSDRCEKEHYVESAYWERRNERYRLEGIQYRIDNRNEHNKCLNCGDPIFQKINGRFRRYCDNICKQEAYRKRKKAAIN